MLKVSFVNLCGVAIAPEFFFFSSCLNQNLKIFIALQGMQGCFQLKNQN